MVFDCESNGSYVAINALALEPAGGSGSGGGGGGSDGEDSEEEGGGGGGGGVPRYTGPPFEALDETLQQAFLDYLEERGVDAALGGYLVDLAADKAAAEYLGWLQRVRAFVSA